MTKATLFTTDAQPREREPARVPTFPRLRAADGSVIAPGSALPVGTRFTRVDPPHETSIDVKFHTWRMVTWEVVRVDNSWKRAKNSDVHHPATLGFVVRGERELTADEIAWWQDYDGRLVGLREAA